MNFSEFIQSIKEKNIDVIGIGISNIPLINLLCDNGAFVSAFDRRSREQLGSVADELESKGVKLVLGDDYLDHLSSEIIFKTPGLRYDVPQLEAARKRGAVVTSEMEIFCEVCPSKIIAVTGSDGKTTTTTLIGKILEAAGKKVWVGGNIGTPLLSKTPEISHDDYVVLELSSFQLHTMKNSPDIAVITNITPNHLDMHKDYQEYIDAKKNIMLYQNESNILVTNFSNEVTKKIGTEAKAHLRYFSSKSDSFISLKNECIYYGDEEILNIHDIKIPGMHNVENYMAAIGAVYEIAGKDAVNQVAKNFGGVEHRLEFVREFEGVKYYNSSIDSSPNRTINTMRVFEQKLILICGGKDKGIPYDELGPHLAEHVKTLVLIGATSDKILGALNDETKKTGKGADIKIIKANTYDEAVNAARENAVSGDIVLLSSASTSFDMFKNFEERGNLFKSIVNSLN